MNKLLYGVVFSFMIPVGLAFGFAAANLQSPIRPLSVKESVMRPEPEVLNPVVFDGPKYFVVDEVKIIATRPITIAPIEKMFGCGDWRNGKKFGGTMRECEWQ